MALSLGSGDFRGGNVFKLGDTLLEVFPFQRGRGRGEATAKLPSIMFSAPSLSAAASDLIVTSPSVRFMPGGKNGKYATSVRPSLKKPARSHDGFGGEPFKGFHAAVFIPTGAGTASAVFLKFG